MNCDKAREQLTAYLDGELEGDRGTAVRGHLRTCDACRAMSADEAALRDGLRSLPPVDPPASLWANVQAQLAKEEVVESQRPAWKRAVSRWMPMAPRFALGMSAVAAAAVLLLVWRTHHHPRPHEEIAVAVPHETAPAPVAPPDATTDVTTEIAAAPAKMSDDLAQAAKGLLADARTESARWSDEQKQTFETEVGQLQAAIDGATEGRARHAAYRAMIRYLQGAAIRDEVALR